GRAAPFARAAAERESRVDRGRWRSGAWHSAGRQITRVGADLMPGGVLFGETVRGQLTPGSSEAAGAGAALAHALGAPLQGVLIGHDLAAAAEEFRRALAVLYLIEGTHYRKYVAHARVAAAEAVIRECAPSVVLFTHTLATREWVPQLAARLDAGLVLDCTAL